MVGIHIGALICMNMSILPCMPVGSSCRATPVGSQMAAVPAAQVVQGTGAPGSLRSFLPWGLQNGLTASWVLALFTLPSAGFKPKFAGVQFCSGDTSKAPLTGCSIRVSPFGLDSLTPFYAPEALLPGCKVPCQSTVNIMTAFKSLRCFNSRPCLAYYGGRVGTATIHRKYVTGLRLLYIAMVLELLHKGQRAEVLRLFRSSRGHDPAKSHQGCSTGNSGISRTRSSQDIDY